jgi:molybdopterin molybdotransferase
MADKKLISVEDAEKIISAFPVSVKAETVPLLAAHDRFLAQDLFSPRDIPEFDKSAMDGFAYISQDSSPAYQIVETIAAGTPPRIVITPGQCARIMTGAMIPTGADRVVRRECAYEENDLMKIIAEDKNFNIRRKGEDLRTGKLVLARGVRLRAPQVAMLASLGLAEATVARPPCVGILATGSEIVEPGTRLGTGQIYNSNAYSLSAQLRETGAEPVVIGHVADSAGATVKAIAACTDRCDVLILSGGVSVGDFDFVPQAMRDAGYTLHFERIAVQPGMPTVFGSLGAGFAFGLPGNPVSTFVIFEILIKPLLLRMMGHSFKPLIQSVVLADAFSRSQGARTAFIPVKCQKGRASLVGYHGSAHLHALSRANALLRIPAGQVDIPAGSTVDVRYL